MSRHLAMLGICYLIVLSAACGEGLFDWGWRADTRDASAWRLEPSWQPDPSPGAVCRSTPEGLCFIVPDAGHGMKWSQGFLPMTFADSPYLLLDYRAEGLANASDSYLVYIDDMVPGVETRPVILRDAIPDGAWHSVAVDLRRVAQGDRFRTVGVHVRAAAGEARVWIRQLRLSEHVPAGTTLLHAAETVAQRPDWWADVAQLSWEARPGWLTNPDPAAACTATDAGVAFAVPEPGLGMKWSCFFTAPVALTGHRYVVLRYRSTGTAPRSDYALCVLGEGPEAGKDYVALIHPEDLRHDGTWHVLSVPLRSAVRDFPQISGLALQAQAAVPDARFEVSRLGLTHAPEPIPALDYLGGEEAGLDVGFQIIPVEGQGVGQVDAVLSAEGITGWPDGRTVRVDAVSFVLPNAASAVPATGLTQRGELGVSIGATTSQLFLLMLALYRGAEEEVYSTAAKLTTIREIDRFGVGIEYDDGTHEECFPYNVTAADFRVDAGAQVLCLFTDPARRIARVRLIDSTPGGGFVVLACTARRGERLVDDPDEQLPDFRRTTQRRDPIGEEHLEALFGAGPRPLESCRLWDVVAGGRVLAPESFVAVAGEGGMVYDYPDPAVRLTLGTTTVDGELQLTAAVTNRGDQGLSMGMRGPRLGPLLLGDAVPEHQWYVFPAQGTIISNRAVVRQARYGGRFPLQMMAAVNPSTDDGVYLRTLAQDVGIRRDYCLSKTAAGVSMWVDYPECRLAPGQTLASVPARIGRTGGDWRTAFALYRDWLRTWYQPCSPRQAWFRDVYTFRQRFLHSYDPLYDAATGRYDLQRAIDEGRTAFGGIDYLHLFDWGNVKGYGRLYGRTGDYSPFEGTLKGGVEGFRDAIAAVRAQGLHVGLYIEGYLLEEKGRLGQAHGQDWQIIQSNGEPLYWPESSEMMTCSHVPAWREVQARTYADWVEQLQVDGMYLDQFGFANEGKDCWSDQHGHAVPGSATAGEYGLSQQVREGMSAVAGGVVLYGEEAPCDVNSQMQDGSFSYHMAQCRREATLLPLHPLRFAVPSFKTFEILVCDHPMGGWAEGVTWTFFNGEGLWLEGVAQDWFRPETLQMIRRCHALLSTYREAFRGDDPIPMEPTLTPGVFANVFSGAERTVLTLYNARHRSALARVPLPAGTAVGTRVVLDAWNGIQRPCLGSGAGRYVNVPMSPRGVGCLVLAPAAP